MAQDRRPENMERITTPELAKAFIAKQIVRSIINQVPFNKSNL